MQPGYLEILIQALKGTWQYSYRMSRVLQVYEDMHICLPSARTFDRPSLGWYIHPSYRPDDATAMCGGLGAGSSKRDSRWGSWSHGYRSDNRTRLHSGGLDTGSSSKTRLSLGPYWCPGRLVIVKTGTNVDGLPIGRTPTIISGLWTLYRTTEIEKHASRDANFCSAHSTA